MVIFVGPQGSGKSTQIDLLFNWLKSHNFRVKKTQIIHKHLFAYLFDKILMRLGRYHYWIYPSGEKTKILDITFERRILGFWLFTQTLSVITTVFFRVYFWLWLRYIVIAERCIPDSVIHLLMEYYGVKSSHYETKDSIIVKFIYNLLRFIPKNSLIVFLYSDYDGLRKRYKFRSTPTEPEFYISEYAEFYQALIHSMSPFSYTCLYIDTTQASIAQTFEEIKRAFLLDGNW